jgi:O-succinylbenzoic acid--CoA ligase
MSAGLLAKARARGFRVLQTYGLTEACSQVSTERPGSEDGATAGAPLSGLRVRIVDDAGRSLAPGEVGEIEVHGPTVMKGYFEDAQATAEAVRDGWLRTRDLGALDQKGRLRILARRTDLIVSGGENVYPAEVEGVFASHPEVLELGVVGVDDPEWGQIPIALWSARTPGCDEEVLRAWGKGRLAGFKVPRRFLCVEALPRTGSGKVDRARLRTLAINTLQMSEGRKAL